MPSLAAYFFVALDFVIVFAVSTFVFDLLHWTLHKLAKSRVSIFRAIGRWHMVHHQFLDRRLRVNSDFKLPNFIFHLIPEYAVTILVTIPCFFLFNWIAVLAVMGIHTLMFFKHLFDEGVDGNHMAMTRVPGRLGAFWVNASYHAQHHINFDTHFSSFLNIFDLVFGTAAQFRKRTFVITGTGGALGSALAVRLEALGAQVIALRHGVDYGPGDYERARSVLAKADVLVLAHGSKADDCWNANYVTFVGLIETFKELGRQRLNPPEVWALGSEAEWHGDLGQAELVPYVQSKRAFAARAAHYYGDEDLTYRHIVPSAFRSSMGWGPLSPDAVAAGIVFFVRRGFRYIPITLTGLAFLNFLRFLRLPRSQPVSTAKDLS